MLIALDTNLGHRQPFDTACGRVGETQLGSGCDTVQKNRVSVTPDSVFRKHHPFMHLNPVYDITGCRSLMRTVYERVDNGDVRTQT